MRGSKSEGQLRVYNNNNYSRRAQRGRILPPLYVGVSCDPWGLRGGPHDAAGIHTQLSALVNGILISVKFEPSGAYIWRIRYFDRAPLCVIKSPFKLV